MDTQQEESRAAKLALARKKLKDHQEKKLVSSNIVDSVDNIALQGNIPLTDNNNIQMRSTENVDRYNCEMVTEPIQSTVHHIKEPHDMDINVTEILISNKRNLECQITELETKLSLLNSSHSLEVGSHNTTKQQLNNLQSEFKHMNDRYMSAMEKIVQLDKNNKELTAINSLVCEERHNLAEQLEFTKSILTTKETENASMRFQLQQLQSEFDVTKLQLQQLNTGSTMSVTNNTSNSFSEQNETLLLKVNSLEQQLNITQKERDQINTHYENYVSELNEQLKSVLLQNEELSTKVHNLLLRESNLIEQISDMEIRLQNINSKKELIETQAPDQAIITSIDKENIQEKYTELQDELQSLKNKYMDLEQLYAKSDAKVIELQEIVNANTTHDNISISKLTADIASDKVAAQRATEQNKKLKSSMQELEEAFIKMSQDKLDLTEKLTAEKYLNRELTIKLADIEENSKNMHTKLMAKDEEMIRLQVNYRDLEKEFDQLFAKAAKTNESPLETVCSEHDNEEIHDVTQNLVDEESHHTNEVSVKEKLKSGNSISIPQEDAMFKLQERFMKIMGEVADLSDEKHRLEHIILQLQNETDTICEYVALYQQQRSLLKRRDEERSAQIQLFQVECDRLKNQLEELSGLLIRFAEDQELATYFEVESRQKDMDKVRSLLLNLKSNTLVDPKNNLDLSNVYPCNCCSGNLINV